MNSNKNKIELSSHLGLKFEETVTVNNANIDKFKVISEKSENDKINSNNYYTYIESDIDESNLDKNKLAEYINNSISSNPNEYNIYIDSISQFYINGSSNKHGGGGGDSASNSYGKQKLEFFNSNISNNGISLHDSEKLKEACMTINTASACISGIENLLNRMRGFHLNLNNSYSSFKNGINDIGLRLANITKWHSIDSVVNLYKDSFEKINNSILLAMLADAEMRRNAGNLELPDELREAVGDEAYNEMQEAFNKEWDLYIADLTPNEDGKINIKSVDEAYKRLSSIQQRFVTSSKEEILIMLDPNIKSADDIKGENLTAEQKQAQYEQIVKNRDNLYNSLAASTIGGMDRATFDSFLMQDMDKLAGMLANAAALETYNAFKGRETDSKNTYNEVLNTSINDMRDSYYASSVGQERLLGYFNEQYSSINDDYNAIGNTEYIKFCISNNRQYSWLKPELRGIADTINKINNYDKFSSTRELDINDPTDAEIIKQIVDYKNNNNQTILYGYEERNGKYYVREYTSLGQQLLYHMDYHYAENTWNNGENKFITAFSNQGYVDAIERGYKNTWIENRIGDKVASLGKNTEAYKNAERDYYILSGDISDSKRKKELKKEGELSFSDLVKCVNVADGELKNLLDMDFVKAHKGEFAEILDSNSIWNIKADLFSKNPFLYGMDTLGNSEIIALNEAIVGLCKFGENIVDAVNTAVHSDYFLSEFKTVDNEGNIIVDLSELDDLHRELYETCWEKYKSNGLYDKDFQKFVDSNYGKKLSEMVFNQQYLKDSGIYIINGKSYTDYSQIPSSVIEQCMSDCSIKAFEYEKVKEWNVLDSSSSNQYMAAFKLGIRNGGDFSYLDNNVSSTIKEAADKQFQTQLDVEVDKVGSFVQENIYSNEQYRFIEDNSFVKHDNILGMVFNQVGNMAVPIGLSMIPGVAGAVAPTLGAALAPAAGAFQALSSTALFTSAFGGAAEEAFINGASYNEALKYATLSAATELVIEHVFSGIGGYGEGWLDNALEYLPNKFLTSTGLDTNLTAQKVKTLIIGGIGEAVEEVTTDFVTPLWQSMTYMNEKSYEEIVKENVSLESLTQTALVSFLSSMIFKGVEIKQQKSTYNKNLTNLQNRISTISDINLNRGAIETQAKKVLAQYIGGIIENEGVIKSGLLEQLIKTTSKELLTANPEYAQELGKLQEQLESFNNQKITIGEGKNSISITGAELLKLEDFTGFDGKYTIEDGKIKFETEEAQNKFNNKVFEMAQNQTNGYNSKLGDLVSELKNAKDSLIIDERKGFSGIIDKINNIVFENDKVAIGGIESAVAAITELGNITSTSETVLLEHNGSIIQIPKAILPGITTKLSIEEGKIKFKKDMNSGKFIQKLYDKAIDLCNEKIGKNSYDIDKIVNKGLINKAIDAIRPSLAQSNSPITVMNSSKIPDNNLTKYDIKVNYFGIPLDASVYIEGNTDATALNQSDKVNELIKNEILRGNASNIYLGQLIYDAKTKEMNSIKNNSNLLYVKSLELEANKTSGNVYKLQNVINSLIEINGNLKDSEIVTIQKDDKNILITKSLLEEITSKYKIVDDKVKFTKDMSVDKFISAVYDKAINLNEQKILGIQNTTIKNSVYYNTDGMDLYKLEVETIIDGETKTINVYVDGNTDVSSLKDSTKISQMLYQLLYENKNSNNVYVGQIVYDEKTGKINISENAANKLYVDGLNKTSESNSSIDVVVNEETSKSKEMDSDNAKSGEIKKGESYEYSVEEINEDDSTIKPKETVEAKEKPANTGGESVITNVAGTASVAATAGATSQAIYQNNVESSSAKDTSKAKNISPKSNTQVKENDHIATNNNNIINISEIKSQINSYIDSIKTECEKYIEMHQNDENFEHRFEQFKRDKIMELNDKLSEVRKTIIDSNSAELNAINEKINSLSENDSLRDELISQRDKLIEKQQQELSNIATSANEKLQKVFSELVVNNNTNTTSQVANNASTTLETNDNIEVIKVSEINNKVSYKIETSRTKFDMNKSYDGYEYVVKPKTDLLTAINEIKSGNFGNVLIEIPNTLELTQEVVDNIPSNVEVRITGGYTLEFLNTRGLRNSLATGVASLQHTTYTASELRGIVSELNKFDSLVDPSWSDSKKAQFVYEYLRDNFEYHGASEIVGGNQTRAKYYDGLMNLVQRQSTCQGFAYTYNALLERLNVKSYVVSGALNGVGQHVFNVVELDGKLVVVDSTRELLNSNKYTGTGFNPNSVFEYEFRSHDNLLNQLVKDTLIDLQTSSNLENALKTGEYRGVSIETALSELSRIDGVNLDSKLQELVKTSENLGENEVLFNIENVYYQNAEPLILTKEFVSTLTVEQREFLTQISTEEGLIDYLQNNQLTNVELLERSELAHTDNKYVNKLIELTSENQGITKQIYNVEDVVRNNSNPVFIESTYKGDTHTLSTNEVLDFMKTGKVDTKYSYSDYVKATNTLMNDLASQKATIEISEEAFNLVNKYNDLMSGNRVVINIDEVMANSDITPITLPSTINDVDSNIVYRYLTDPELLNNLLNGSVSDANVPQLASALKTLTMMKDYLGLQISSQTMINIENLYMNNVERFFEQAVESKLPKIYFEYQDVLTKCNGNHDLAITEFEKMGHSSEEIVLSLLSTASSKAYNYEYSRNLYDYSCEYLIDKGYSKKDSAFRVTDIYKKLLDLRGYDTITTKDGLTINIQKGLCWYNQVYTIDYIQKEFEQIKNIYKTSIPFNVYIHDTFNFSDKVGEIVYNMNIKAAASANGNTIRIFYNLEIRDTVLCHEYAHLIDQQIMKDQGLDGRFANTQEYLDAIAKDNGAPTAYAKTNSVEDFAESVAHMRKNPIEFKNKFPNRYEVLSKYISIETSANVTVTNTNLVTETITQNSNVDSQINNAFENMVFKFGMQESFEKLCEYVRTGNIDVFTEMDDVRKTISSVDKNVIIKYLNENFGEEIVNEHIGLVDEGIDTRDTEAFIASNQDMPVDVDGNVSNTVINNSQFAKFDIVIDGKVENTLNISELVSNSYKISDCYELMEEFQYDEFNTAIVNYIDYVKENNISVDIDSNVMKFYESYKYAKENNVFIVNEDRILEKGSDMIAIPQEIYNKYKNDLIYQEIVDTIIESVQSLENFEKFISIHYLSNDMYMIYMNDVINCIEPSIKANENFNAMSNVISKLNEYAIKDFGLFLSNIHEMIYENANPVYLPYYINGEFKNGHQAISTSILLDTILGKSQFPSSYNANITENCRILYNYLQSNNITLNENIMEKLEFISKLNDNQIISNLEEYFDGQNPIVVNKNTNFGKTEISTLKIIEILEMKSDFYIEFLRDGNIKYLFDSINKLFKTNPELRDLYKDNFKKLKSVYYSSYVIENSTAMVSNTFGKYKTSFLDNIVNNPNQIYKYNKAERQNIINAINELSEYLSNNRLIADYNSQLLEFISRDVPIIDSRIEIKSPLYNIFKRNGRVFGADQGVVRKIIENSKIDVLIQFIQGRYIGTDKFLQTLNEMNISEEKFRKILETSSRGFIFTNGDVKISELANLVIKNYPGMSGKDAVQFLHLLETEEAGGRGICNYASMANLIFDKYKNNTKLFEEHFGYPMYIEVNGKERLNTSMLLVDMYSIINDGVLVTYENGVYNVNINNENYLNLSDNGKINMTYFQKFLDKKGINFNISEEFRYNSFNTNNMIRYEEVITNIHDSLARGEHIHLSSGGFNLYYPNGIIANKNVGSHIMSVVGITSDGKLIVDSWGQELIFNLEEQMSRVGENYNSYNITYPKYIKLVSYDISMNGSENINNQTQTMDSSHIDTSSSLEVFDIPSPKATSSLDSVPYRNTLDESNNSSRVERNTTNSIELDDSSVSNTEATGYDYTVEISKPSKTNTTVAAEDLVFIDEVKDVSAPYASFQDVQSNVDSDLVSTVSIDGKEIEVEKLKQLQTPSNLETALKTGEYAGVRIEKALVELSKLDGVTLDSKLQELVKISESLKQSEIIFNIEDVYSNGVMPNTINIDVYNEFIRSNPNSNINIDGLYKIINSNSVIYRLISNDTIIKNVSNESIKESLSYLVSISNRYNYENKVIRETQYLLNLLEKNYTTEELYDAFAIAHTEFNTPDIYYEFYDYLKTMDVDSAVKLLESKGYTTLDITDAFLNLAIRMDSQELSKRYYYKAFDYLVENGIDEKEAATIITDKYRTLLYRRGTRVVTTTPNGVKIKIVNNISSNNKLFTVEKIESMIKQAEKYYAKTGLKEIVIFDSFAPHNIYSEKVQYENYVKTHNNRRFVSAASASKSSIILWEDFDKLDSIVHEYGHTIDKHIKLVNKLATDFSSSSTWLDAIQKDTAITFKRVSEYAYASNGEDFAEFIKFFNRNPLEVARKYPNRYKAASKYLNLDIDSNIIERYLDSKKFFIAGIEDLSNLLTEDGSMLEFIKQYVFENLKGDNSIAKTVISELDAIYESKLDIIEDYGLYSLFIDMSEQERIGSHEFIKIMKDYLDGKDISSKFKDSRNLEIIKLLENEQIQEWYEEELNEMTAETEKISVSDEEFEKLLNSISNDSESNSSSDTNVIEESETMDFPIQDIPTTEDLKPYKVVQKHDHNDLIISEELVEKFSQRTIDAFISIYNYIPNLGQYIGKMDISGKTKLLDIINSLNVDIDSNSTLKQLKNLIEQLDGRHVFNLGDLSNDSKLVMLPKELYTQYGEQIDYLHNICSREYSLKSFLENPDLKILKELKDGLFKDANFDPNTYYLIQKLYDASNVLLEDKVIVNTKNFVSKKGTELIVVDKETFELYKEELKQFDYITEDVYNLRNFILNSSDVEILKLKNLFDEVNLETSDEFINKVKNIIYELSNGKTILNIREYNWIENPIIMSKDIYNSNKEIVDNVVESIEYNSTLSKYLESIDVDTAIKLKQLIDKGDLVINTKNGEILNKLINDIASENKIVNLYDVVNHGAKPLVISGEVYNDYVNLSSNSDIAIDVIYDLFDSKDLIYRLLSNNTIFNNVSNENVINSLKLYLSVAENKGYSDSVTNEIKFYLDVMSDTPQFIPSEFNGYKARTLEIILNNPTKINGYTAFEKKKILKAVNEYSEFMKNNYPERYLNYVDNINVLTRNVPKIDSSIAIETELYRMFENIGKIFGADQGAVRKLLTRLKMNDVVQFLCGNKIEENNFMDTLNNMHFTEEQFKNKLLEVNKESKSFLTDENTFDSLKEQVMKNYPGMSEKDATQFLYLMEAYKDSEGICNYAAAVNLIFNKYKNNPRLFEEHFGYPMYVTLDGKNELNTTMLLVDMYSIINDGGLVTNENGVYKVNTSNEKYLNLSDNGKLNMEYFQKFLDRKGIKFNIEETYYYQSERRAIPNSFDMMHYEEVIKNIHDCLARGEHVDISAYGFNLYKLDGTIIAKDVGGHIMTVVGITSDGNLIVDSWGMKLIFNLKEQMSNLGDVYEIEKNFGIEIRRRVNIVSYDISFDNSNNTSTNSNLYGNINNSTNTQTSGESINSPKSSVTSTIDANSDIIDVSDDIKNVDLLMSRNDLSKMGYESVQNTDILFDSEVIDVNEEINKILKDKFYLEKFIKSKDTSLARSISNLIQSGDVDLSSPIGIKLKQIVDAVVDNGHLINLNAFVYGTESPIVVNNEVYIEYERINTGKKIEDLYKMVKEDSLYEKLSGKERDMYIKSIDTLLELSNDKNMLINELEVISKTLKQEPSTAFDIISKYHMEAKLPRGYSEYSDLLKSGLSINEAISQLENLGYSYSEISYIVMSEAMTTYNSDSVQKSYYDMFEYLKQKFIEENPKVIKEEQELIKYAEQEAANKVRKNLTELFQIRGSKPVLVTSSLVEIRVVNNAQIDSIFIENISEQLSKIENIYGRSALETIVIYDTISPENLINEIIKYPNYRVKFPNKHFMTQASATRTNINIYNSFNSLDTLSHEYGHTLDKGPLSTRVYDEKKHTFKTILFSESGAWQRAVKIDNKSISSYGDLNLEEDFADFIKAYTKNPVATMLKYPNRYLEMSSKLGIKIDEKVISEYMSNTRLIDVLNSISNIIETSTLDLIKEYVFNGQIDNNGYTFIDDILKSVRYDKLLNTIDASSVINEIQKSYNLTDEKVTFLLEQIIRGNNISDLLSESDIKLIELLDDERLKETYRDYLEINDVSTKNQIIKDADVDMAFPKKSIFSKRIETVSVSDIPRVFRNMNTSNIISILEGKTTLMNDENYINNKKSIIRFVKYLSENNIKLSLNERANTIIENLRNGDFRLNILNFSDVLNGDTPIYGPSSINLDGIKISTDDVIAYLENKKNEISSIITSETPNEDARDLLNAIDELGSKNDIIYDKYRESIKLIERIERSYVYNSYDSYYLLPKSFNGIDTTNILNSDLTSLVSYINSLSNADKKTYRVALDEFGKYIYKSNTRLSKQDLSRVNKLYDVINTKKFRTDAVIKSKIYDSFEMSYQNDGEFGSNQGKVREVIEKLGITDVIQGLFSEKVERSKFLETLSEFNISERDFITALNKRTQRGIMNDLFKDGDINLELYGSLIRQVKINYPNMSTMEAVRFLYLIETKEAGGPGICNNPILVNMIFDRYIGRENIFERDFGYPMYINANNGKKVLNEARLLVDIFSTLNDGVLVHNVNGNYVINTTSENYVRAYDLNGLRLDAVEKYINKKGINLNLSKTYFFNSNEELMHYDYLMEQIKNELDKGNYVIFGGKGFDMDVENFEFRKDCDAHGMTIVGIDTTGELILDSWGMKARVDLKKELSRLNTKFKDRNSNMNERIFTISSYNID